MNARLRLATVTALPDARPSPRPAPGRPTGATPYAALSVHDLLLPEHLCHAALVDPAGDGEIEITDEMVRAALDAIEDELVTPYRDGRAPAASVARRADVIPFPVHRTRRTDR